VTFGDLAATLMTGDYLHRVVRHMFSDVSEELVVCIIPIIKAVISSETSVSVHELRDSTSLKAAIFNYNFSEIY
jgi:hypothetical protein